MRNSLCFFLLVSLVACATSPEGRKQLILLPDSQLDSMGVQAFQQMKSEQPTVKDPLLNEYVRCIVNPIVAVSGSERKPEEWEIAVFQEDSPNAFALPGGKIGVHTGMLKIAKTDDQLAAVLGHEVGHVLARHGNERVSEGVVQQGGQAALAGLLGDKGNNKTLLGLLGLGLTVGVALPHSRTQESEADSIGLDFMSKAGFNPRGAVELWKNMESAGGGGTPEFLSTHPSHGTRIGDLEKKVPEAMPVYEQVKASGKTPRCSRPAS